MVFWATNDMMSGFAACSRLYNSILIEENEHIETKLKQWPKNYQGKIEFRNVTFNYGNIEKNGHQVLKNVSFTIEPNQRTSLVGPTGCGKTTLIKLLLRLYEPQEGTIYLDGEDVRNYPLIELRKHIGYIEQDIFLFSQSIQDNIAFGKPEATLEEILAVSKLAQVHDFVTKFPKKYNTLRIDYVYFI